MVKNRLGLVFTCLVSLGMAAVACSDDDATDSNDDAGDAGMAGEEATAGSAGSNAGRGGGAGSAGKGGAASAGRSNGGAAGSLGGSTPVGGEGGAPTGEAGQGGTAAGGTAGEGGGGANAGTGTGGTPPIPGAGGAGAAGEGGGGVGGEPSVGGEGGGGGEAPFVADVVINGDFEKGETRVSLPGWDNDDMDASYVEYNESAARNGYGRLAHWSADPYTATISQVIAPIENGTYRLSVYVNRDANAEYDQYIFARNCGGDEVTESTATAGTDGWTEVALSVDVTAGSCEIGIHSDAPSGGMWANFDDLTFTME